MREERLCSLIFKEFLHLFGAEYLQKILKPLCRDIKAIGKTKENKLLSTSQQKKVDREIRNTFNRLTSALTKGSLLLNPYVREVLSRMCTVTKQRFPALKTNEVTNLIGGVFFLRFLCPAIINAQDHLRKQKGIERFYFFPSS